MEMCINQCMRSVGVGTMRTWSDMNSWSDGGRCKLRHPPNAKLNPGRHSQGGVVDSFGQIGGRDPGGPDRPMRGVRSRPVNGRDHISQCRRI